MFSTATGGFGGGDFESLARQYWNAWGQAMRQGAGSASQPDWQQTLQWWQQMLPAQTQAGSLGDMLGRFNQQAGDWYGQMQQVAARFAGADNNAADIGKAWREALGANASAANPFADVFGAMKAWGSDDWNAQIKPWLETMQRFGGHEHFPAFGPAREHQQRWQAFADAAQEYQQRNSDYNALLMKIGEKAFAVFEVKLDERDAPGKQIGSARALFDLWIDATEEVYAEAALSDDFRHVIGALSNAQMRLRAAVQKEAEQFCNLFGLPTRTEVDSAHRKIVELERALRKAARTSSVSRSESVSSVEKIVAEPKSAPAEKSVRKVTRKSRKPVAKTTAANRTSVTNKSKPVKKAAATKKAKPKKTSAPKPATAASKTSAKIVSMKDWVARGMASIEPPASNKKRSRK
jgi:hypothetical protein